MGRYYFGNMSLVKYNSAGTLQWQKSWKRLKNGTIVGKMVAVDGLGNIHVVGKISTTDGLRIFLLKFNTSGIRQWNCT